VHGDRINQLDLRIASGASLERTWFGSEALPQMDNTLGLQLHNDDIDTSLFHRRSDAVERRARGPRGGAQCRALLRECGLVAGHYYAFRLQSEPAAGVPTWYSIYLSHARFT
jgi:hypothetical protein